MTGRITLTSISWIESSRLPHAGVKLALGGTPWIGSWANRVVMGLVATSNPTPPDGIAVENFRSRKQYRALTSFDLFAQFPTQPKNIVLDPGYTPPFNKTKVDTFLVHLAPIPDTAKEIHAGEKSSLSACLGERLHPCSTLRVSEDWKVVASTLIKFRAGAETNKIGISDDVGSPNHVPWVWCEYAVVRRGKDFLLLANGSKFPSHTWYINGRKVAAELQAKILVSEKEPAISTGRPKDQPRSDPARDESSGAVTEHEYAIQGGNQIEVDVSQYFI